MSILNLPVLGKWSMTEALKRNVKLVLRGVLVSSETLLVDRFASGTLSRQQMEYSEKKREARTTSQVGQWACETPNP